ncbi:DUF3445 domain-containing protein [Geminicoccaceae bacterium 1502E]|nr:DUF3445 domain-containing protein [Geminicoccaceae bacterium 1502E]
MSFLDGPWRMAMGLRRLDPAEWLVADGQEAAELAEKRRLYAERPDEVLALLPEGQDGAAELLRLLAAHLAERRSAGFALEDEVLVVRASGERVPLDAPDPLARAGLLVQEDLCLMARQRGGGYALVGASLCFPMRWRLADKVGRAMAGIHEPVPGFAERLGGPADRFFAALEPDRPVWRANWSLTDDPRLFQPDTRTRPMALGEADAGQDLWLRVERQTLRRLPQSGQVVFTIRTFRQRLEEAAGEPQVAAALAARIREMPEPMLRYKNLLGVRETLLRWLDRRAVASA